MTTSCRLRVLLTILGLFCGNNVGLADYLWPLPFGNELTSIFGDYRTRRYHVGIDIRTGGEVGKPVVAPSDGYIMRVRTGYFGYGKAINFKMADGNISVFAHLNAFAPAIEEFIRDKQIASESYNQDIELSSDKFPFKRGETIAFSGQTGVGAPHLHFEVRTPDNVPINPLTLDGLEVDDKTAPIFRSLRLVGFDNDELAQALGWDLSHSFRKTPGSAEYTLSTTLPGGLEDYWLAAEIVDKVGKSAALKPIYELEVRCLDRELYHLRYDKVSYDATYMIDAQRNFGMAQKGNQEYYNLVDVETVGKFAGISELVGQDPPPIEIIASDAAGNSSKAVVRIFDASHSSKGAKFVVPKPDTARLNSLLDKYGENHGGIRAAWIPGGRNLYLLVKMQSARPAKVSAMHLEEGQSKPLNQLVGRFYLGIVDRISDTLSGGTMTDAGAVHVLVEPAIGESSSFELPVKFKRLRYESGEVVSLTSDDRKFVVEFPGGDEPMFPLEENYYYMINRTGLGRYPNYTITPSNSVVLKQVNYRYFLGDSIPKGIGLYSVGDKSLFYLGGVIDSGARSISTGSHILVTITARQDTVPPSIHQLRPAARAVVRAPRPQIGFRFGDDLSGVSDDIDIRIDGKWCIPVYDPESGLVSSTPHFDLSKGKHKLEIKVSDKAGNLWRMSTEFSRGSQ